MDWVKRNLGFVVGSVVAVALLLFSGFYLYSNSKKNNNVREELEREYAELQRLSNLNPHPGKGKVNNILRARQQKEEVLQFMKKMDQCFKPIPAIPSAARVTGEDFSADLRRTIDQLNRQAVASSVIVPTNYNFSFEAEKRLVKFAPGSLPSLAVQVGEVKVICGILFSAKVNKLTGLRRERVSPDDRTGPQSDYLRDVSITNELAVISPYEISFESFSAELANVMSGFANSPYGIVIKSLDVQPAKAVASPAGRRGPGGYASAAAAPVNPFYAPTPGAGYTGEADGYTGEAGGGYTGEGGRTGIRQPTFRRPTFRSAQTQPYGEAEAQPYQPAYGRTRVQPYQPAYTPRAGGYPAGAAGVEASQTLIDEHPLSVTLLLDVIKLLPPKED